MRAHYLRSSGLAGLAAMGLVACTSAHHQSQPLAAEVVCVTERVTGSLIPRRYCRNRAVVENQGGVLPKLFISYSPPPISQNH